ncbi:MAG: cation:proton antiporter [Candidatus Omnitrophica bacterium]|nr:cation:proton antiporter [Candidatus Omnitrophota bacterium]
MDINILFLTGIAIFLGILGGGLFQKLKIPQVVGYIIIGALLGKSVLKIFPSHALEAFTPLVNFTLGAIGFLIGTELKKEVFDRYGRSIYFVLIAEGMMAFFLVFAAVTLLTKKMYLGLLFGAIASATDPASTVNVLWEYKARGPLTTTVTSIVALDDGLALLLYGLVSVFSHAMIAHEHYSLWRSIGLPLIELTECLGLGILAGIILIRLISYFKDEFMLSLALGGIAVLVGLSVYFRLDLILTTMTMGAVIVNRIPKISEKLTKRVKESAIPLYIFFFVFVGASLDIHVFFQFFIISIVIAYLISRSAGKIFGSMMGGWLSGARKTVTKYSGICLFTQGGVAIGLAMSIAHNLSDLGQLGIATGITILNVVVATTFVVQLIGPIFVKIGITKADEAWRNVTEEDIIESSKVRDFMRTEFSFVKESASLDKILDAVKEREAYHLPVVNNQGELTGLISLGSLRGVFRETQLDDIVFAKDVAVPVGRVLYPDEPLKEAFDIFSKREIDYLAVVKNAQSKEIVGIIEYQPLVQMVSRKTLERQKSLDRECDEGSEEETNQQENPAP